MTILVDHFPINIADGSHEYGPVNVPDGARVYTLRLARCTDATPTLWPNATTTISATILLSKDGGATYPDTGGAMTARGGIVIGPTGQQAPESSFTATAPAGASNLKAKAVVVVSGGPLVSQITVEAS